MSKYIKIIFIFLLLIFFNPCNKSFSQPDLANVTINPGGDIGGIGQQLASAGVRLPMTKTEEKLRRKARRLSPSRKELNIYNRKTRNKELNLIEKIRFPFIRRKVNKLNELQEEADLKYDNAGAQPAPAQKQTSIPLPDKYKLSIKEKDVIQKYNQDSTSLNDDEQKIYKKALKKKDKAAKFKQKNSMQPYDSVLVKQYNNKQLRDSLSKDEIKLAKQNKKIQKKNFKIQHKIATYQADSVYDNGGWTVSSKKVPFYKRIFKKRKKEEKPSSFVKKYTRLKKRYSLTDKQQLAHNNKGRNSSSTDKYRAYRASVKLYIFNKKAKKLIIREYKKTLSRKDRRKIRKSMRQNKKNMKNRHQ